MVMGLWNKLFGVETRQDIPTVPAPQLAALTVTVDTALSVSAVARAVNLIQTLGSGISWAAYKDGRKLDRQPSLITKPGVDGSPFTFRAETLNSLACYGNAYWRIYGSGQSISLEVLDPARVHVYRDPANARIKYDYTDEFGRTWQDIKVKHLKINRRPGHLYGYGPIQLNSSEIKQALGLRAYSDNWFSNGMPMHYLKATDGTNYSPEEKAELQQQWVSALENKTAPAILDGFEYVNLGINPKDAMLVEVWLAVVVNIARAFGIPAMHLLAELGGTSMTYTNLEQDQILFLQDTISGYLNEIEDAMTSLLPRGTECRFHVEDFLRMDHKTKAEVRKAQVDTGVRSSDELRDEDGLDPLPRKDANSE